jgi:hypothetical protein
MRPTPAEVARWTEMAGAGITPLAIDNLETVAEARSALARLRDFGQRLARGEEPTPP